MKDKSFRTILSIVSLGLIIGSAGYFLGLQGSGPLKAEAQVQTAEISNLKDDVKLNLDKLKVLENETKYGSRLHDYHYRRLKDQGIENPQILIDDLTSKPYLIPKEAVLGGIMQFGEIAVLDNTWVYATFEDGHVAGKAIYTWTKNGNKIEWKLLLMESY